MDDHWARRSLESGEEEKKQGELGDFRVSGRMGTNPSSVEENHFCMLRDNSNGFGSKAPKSTRLGTMLPQQDDKALEL